MISKQEVYIVKSKAVGVQRGTQPPTLIPKNVTISELLGQIMMYCTAEHMVFLHQGRDCLQLLQTAPSKETQS